MGWAKYEEDIRKAIDERWASKNSAPSRVGSADSKRTTSAKKSSRNDNSEHLMTSYSCRFMR